MSLRARLLVGLVALVAAGLLVADVVTYVSLRAFLNERVDRQLRDAQFPVLRALTFTGRRAPDGFPGPPGMPAGTFGQMRDATGTIINQLTVEQEGATTPVPSLPEELPHEQVTLTVDSVDGPVRFRVLSEPVAGGQGTLVVAVPLGDVAQTLRRLLGIEVVVTLGVLVALGAISSWLVRLGLRPLEDIGETATGIAAGDLSRRVEHADPRTEVGRLGVALNAMLAQIERAFDERQASEDKLRRFLADASHELRTPLTSIRGYAELFRRGADERPADLAKTMQRIEQESERMGVLVEDLLLLARLDQGRPLERERVDLAVVADDAVADARVVDPSRPITLDSPGSAVVEGDEAGLRQVAANLLSNALTHTPAGTPVEVRVAVEDGNATLEVTDHGAGLPPGEAEHVFERFYRSDPSRTRDSGGVGLGLSIVAAIAKAHGGSVDVDTAPGRGARFRVALPAIPPEADGARQDGTQPDGAQRNA